MKRLLNVFLNYHTQAILIGIIFYLLFFNNKVLKFYYLDTDFIKVNFKFLLAKQSNLSKHDIQKEFLNFEEKVRIVAKQISSNGILLKKNVIIQGGKDITIEVCEKLEFLNCSLYE